MSDDLKREMLKIDLNSERLFCLIEAVKRVANVQAMNFDDGDTIVCVWRAIDETPEGWRIKYDAGACPHQLIDALRKAVLLLIDGYNEQWFYAASDHIDGRPNLNLAISRTPCRTCGA